MNIKDYAKEFARLGGLSKSKAKQLAARRNGKKGGRPKGSKNKPKTKTILKNFFQCANDAERLQWNKEMAKRALKEPWFDLLEKSKGSKNKVKK